MPPQIWFPQKDASDRKQMSTVKLFIGTAIVLHLWLAKKSTDQAVAVREPSSVTEGWD